MLRGLIAQHGFAGSEIASIELSMSDKVISHHGVREPGGGVPRCR
jgi:hypothetical protein